MNYKKDIVHIKCTLSILKGHFRHIYMKKIPWKLLLQNGYQSPPYVLSIRSNHPWSPELVPKSGLAHGLALRPILMLWLVKIWQVSSWGKFMQHASWNLFTLTAEADRVLCQLLMFLTVFFHWVYKVKFSCYQESSVIHG